MTTTNAAIFGWGLAIGMWAMFGLVTFLDRRNAQRARARRDGPPIERVRMDDGTYRACGQGRTFVQQWRAKTWN